MWRLSVLPSPESKLAPVDVVVEAAEGSTVADLAAGLGDHLGGRGLLLAPTTQGRAWPADTPLVDAGLRDGDVLEVSSVPADWRHRPGPRRTPRATVRVVAGPDAGRHADITGDTLTIGRAPSSGLRLSDPLVSRTHARILLSETPVVLDVGSAHGTVVGGRTITRSTPVAFGERITLGSTVVVIHDGAGEAGRERGVLRSPRFGDRVVAAELDTPTPPGSPRPTPLSWPMMLMPILMGAAMFGMTRSPVSLVFMAGFPAMMFATWLMQRGRARREFEEETALWREDLRAVLATIETAAATQRVNAVDDEPDLGVVLARAIARDHRLWVRRDDSDDFLAVRAGLGPRAALVTGKAVTTGDRGLRAEVTRLLGERATLADLPVPLELAEIPLASVTGETDDVDAWVRASVLRLAVTHSPTDLQLAAVLGPGRAHVESWLRWLPHAAPRGGGTACVGIGAGEGQALLEELASADGGTAHTLCLVDEQAGIPRRLVEAVAAAAPDRRLHLLWLGSSIETVPAGTGTAVDLGAQPSAAGRLLHRDRGGIEELTSVESLGLHDVWRAARALSGYRDEAAVLAAESMLPGQVRLPGLSGDLADPDDVDRLLERWATSTGLRAQLGMGGEGVVTIDLREDGPHGLVAGTTGAGKSELLQSLLCSLATNNPPSRITFLLVDYKGGAAFREVAELPHSVGYITDLTPALVQRCLTSLHAELTSREHLLAQYGAKDLLAMERDHPEAAPPAMLICVDEFAALLAEVPEFVEGMVSIAQRGRSLGMHMILATQRPAGVVTPQIKANTDLRIALRVAAPDDSVDVIDAPDAAHLSRRTPGRAWLRRTGHGTRELVQVAWVGAREELHADGGRVRIGPFTARELAGGRHAGTTTLHPRSDLERIVTTTGSAFARSGRPAPKKPWLPPLAAEVPLACAAPGTVVLGTGALDDVLVDGAGAEARRVDQLPGQLVLGLLDRPAEQSQTPWVVDYARGGHLLVYGASGSGKSELLRTVAAAATAGSSGRLAVPDCVYAIDAGGGALSVLERMPSVGSVVLEQQTERMMRLIRMLARTIAERNALLAARGASDVDALAALGTPLQRIHLLVDNLPAVLDAFDGGGPVRREHAEHVTTILQEGRRCGVHVTATTPQRTGLTSPVQAAFGQRLVLRMTVPDDYVMLGVPGVVLDGDSPAGRGLVGRDEVQVATVGGAGTPVQAERLDVLCAAVGERYTDGAALPVPAMPTLVPQHLVPAPEDDAVCVGVEAEYVGAVTLALREAPLLLLGRARSGRTSTLLGLAQAARRSSRPPARITLIGPRAATQLVVADGVLEPAEVVDEVVAGAEQAGAWAEALPATDGDDWHLVLVDDVHLWEREWERSGPERAAVEALTVALTGRRGLAVVAASDPDDARSRQHIPGLTQALRRARRVAVVAPEMSDGSLAATTIPMHTSEPLTGPGRALLVSGGSTHVVQLIAASARTSVNGSLS